MQPPLTQTVTQVIHFGPRHKTSKIENSLMFRYLDRHVLVVEMTTNQLHIQVVEEPKNAVKNTFRHAL